MRGTAAGLVLGVLALFALAQTAAAWTLWSRDGNAIGVYGYVRGGGGWVPWGPSQACFWAPGASSKYRLGNECEYYASVGGYLQLALPDDLPAGYLKLDGEVAIDRDYFDDAFEMFDPTQHYVELGDIANTSTKAWIGRRDNFQRDIHITDYYYFNLFGTGAGVYDVPIGSLRGSYAYYRNRITTDERVGDVVHENHLFGLAGFQLNEGGTLSVDVLFTRIRPVGGRDDVDSSAGIAGSLRHDQADVFGGWNTLVLQYGQGAARGAFAWPFEADWVGRELGTPGRAADLDNARTIRVVDTFWREGRRLGVMALALVEYRRSPAFDGVHQTWVSLGARPTIFLDDHWRLTGEIGLDYVRDHRAREEGRLVKRTLALEWAPERRFFSRPAARLYVTQAGWSDTFRGRVGWPHHTEETQAWSWGLQVEHWW